MRVLAVPVLAAALLAGCAATKKPVVPAEQLWKEGNQAFSDEAWELAVERYKALLDQHPFDPNAEEAELKIAQAHYLAHRYAEAIAAFGDFERMHPTSPNLPLVEYHLGMAYLAQASTSVRDQRPHLLPQPGRPVPDQPLGGEGPAAGAGVPRVARAARDGRRRLVPAPPQPARRRGPAAGSPARISGDGRDGRGAAHLRRLLCRPQREGRRAARARHPRPLPPRRSPRGRRARASRPCPRPGRRRPAAAAPRAARGHGEPSRPPEPPGGGLRLPEPAPDDAAGALALLTPGPTPVPQIDTPRRFGLARPLRGKRPHKPYPEWQRDRPREATATSPRWTRC